MEVLLWKVRHKDKYRYSGLWPSVSGATSFAALVVDNSGVGDLFTASKSGLPLFTIKNNGNVLLGGANATITAPTGLTLQETGDTYGGVALNLQNRERCQWGHVSATRDCRFGGLCFCRTYKPKKYKV